ncbi:MAG: hypothetical protein LBN02_05855 [Oscillospiraceae bacterium]|jgi:hypothetical protein|nr:hypothetical protein [Oscillospiraceae bacterium]
MNLEPEMMRKIADMSEKYKLSFFRVLTWFAENDNWAETEDDAGRRVDKLLQDLQTWKDEK